jgi:integrase
MTGSLKVQHGKYYVVTRIQDINGKTKQKWISTGLPDTAGKRQAQQALRRILTEIEDKKIIYSKDTLFVDWIWTWMEQKKSQVRLNTYEAYEIYVESHIEPYFKPKKLTLNSVEPQILQDYYNYKSKSNNENPPLSPNSLCKHHVVIHGALQEAMKKNLIPYNPADRVSLPKKKEYVGKAYTAEQANLLVGKLGEEPLRSAVILGLFYGLRRSEVCGLRWGDIDFEDKTMMIRNTVVRTKR